MEQDVAATLIQTQYRGRRSRLQYQRKCTEREAREANAVKQQALLMAQQRREEHFAARTIQPRRSRGQGINYGAEGSVPLHPTMVKKGLHTMGRNPHNMRHCYLGLTLNDATIGDLSCIKEFPLLQTVDLGNNLITDLRPLGNLPFLLELRAPSNCITELPDFRFRQEVDLSHQAEEEVLYSWNSEVVRSVSALQLLDLSNNSISQIGPCGEHRFLRRLTLRNNSISKIQGLEELHSLTYLDLGNNSISVIEGLSGLPIIELNLENNNIKTITNVSSAHLPHLSTLLLGNNYITTLGGLQGCKQITCLHLEGNLIESVRQVEFLSNSHFLQLLVLEGCPVCSATLYRYRVISRLQGLVMLDRTPCSAQEKVKAINIHGGDDSDLPNRRMSHVAAFGQDSPEGFDASALPAFVESEPDPVGVA